MQAHDFNFEGGEILADMGASWFVSYAYYEKVDPSHNNWNRVKTAQMRTAKYRKGLPYHKSWLLYVLEMNPKNLNKNTIGLEAAEVKRMAKAVLEKMK